MPGWEVPLLLGNVSSFHPTLLNNLGDGMPARIRNSYTTPPSPSPSLLLLSRQLNPFLVGCCLASSRGCLACHPKVRLCGCSSSTLFLCWRCQSSTLCMMGNAWKQVARHQAFHVCPFASLPSPFSLWPQSPALSECWIGDSYIWGPF